MIKRLLAAVGGSLLHWLISAAIALAISMIVVTVYSELHWKPVVTCE